MTHDLSASSCLSHAVICLFLWCNLWHYELLTWWFFFRSLTQSCLSSCIRMEITPISTSATAGSSWTLKEVAAHRHSNGACIKLCEDIAPSLFNLLFILCVCVRASLWGCVCSMGGYLGRPSHLLQALCPVHCIGLGGGVQRHYPRQQHGLHWYHQVL